VQVTGAKIVTNAKSPGAKCYGFVTMATTEEASKCIQHLHRTELHGRNISVERVMLSTLLLECPKHDFELHPYRVKLYQTVCVRTGVVLRW